MKIVFASNNTNKVKEIQGLIPSNIELLGLKDIGFFEDIEETGTTLEENSMLKARTIYDFCQLPTIADDTGLEVYALNGAPGVHSARYAGLDKSSLANMEKLLANLYISTDRKAQFRTVFSFVDDRQSVQFEGTVEGEIGQKMLGDGGFGYDPIFFPEGNNRTFAQMSIDEKNKMSHRARALQKLVDYLTLEYKGID